jgi:hypothetical protein
MIPEMEFEGEGGEGERDIREAHHAVPGLSSASGPLEASRVQANRVFGWLAGSIRVKTRTGKHMW